jgi:hypothetical protein
MERPSTQSPFAQCWYYLHWGDVYRLLGGRYPSFIAPTDSCADPVTSPPLRLGLVRGDRAGCHQPLLLTGPSRRYSANPSPDA